MNILHYSNLRVMRVIQERLFAGVKLHLWQDIRGQDLALQLQLILPENTTPLFDR